MSNRRIVQVLDQYKKARLTFVQNISDMAMRSQNVALLKKTNVLDLLKPLVSDVCPQIKHCALVALGRLIHADETIAEQIVKSGTLSVLLNDLTSGNKYQNSAILFIIRSICKHNEKLTETVVRNGGLQALVYCLEDFEPIVKESAAWGVGYIARHTENMAQECVDHGALPLLMLCLQEPELSLKQIATIALSDIAKHSDALATSVVDAGILPSLVKNLANSDEKLKRQCLIALSSCAKHSAELAEVIVEAEIFPTVFQHLSHPCNQIKRWAACVVRDVAKHSLELTQLVVNTGGIGALLEILFQQPTVAVEVAVPCISAIGFIAGQSAELAMTIIGYQSIQIFERILNEPADESLVSVTVWAIGQIGRHTTEHAHAVASANIFQKLIALYQSPTTSADLRLKCQNSLKVCLQKCTLVPALEPLLWTAPPEILKYVLGQYSKILIGARTAKKAFSSFATYTFTWRKNTLQAL
ncbi:sperm-associated antigen 6-like isoform X3 [Cylas formicarius]|uniref:sperm-associated antigen 6-like isoform X3 n=1 Tax=Cylas formicarius TaxID=197179 RepID=UPI002958CA3C|nr:sperm-associated antigen 6-like isoform X3 [Cylas formicarius]